MGHIKCGAIIKQIGGCVLGLIIVGCEPPKEKIPDVNKWAWSANQQSVVVTDPEGDTVGLWLRDDYSRTVDAMEGIYALGDWLEYDYKTKRDSTGWWALPDSCVSGFVYTFTLTGRDSIDWAENAPYNLDIGCCIERPAWYYNK